MAGLRLVEQATQYLVFGTMRKLLFIAAVAALLGPVATVTAHATDVPVFMLGGPGPDYKGTFKITVRDPASGRRVTQAFRPGDGHTLYRNNTWEVTVVPQARRHIVRVQVGRLVATGRRIRILSHSVSADFR